MENKKIILKKGLSEGVLSAFYQFGILAVAILEFYFLICERSSILVSPINHEIENDPNLIRFIYMFLAFGGAFALVFLSKKFEESSIKKSFWISLIAGVLLWQSIGECSWHFCLFTDGKALYFPKIEGSQGTFVLMIILPLLAYLFINKKLSWSLEIFIISFMANWLGHYVMTGIASWFSESSIITTDVWFKIVGAVLGCGGSLFVTWLLLFKVTTTESRLKLSIILYTNLGILVKVYLA